MEGNLMDSLQNEQMIKLTKNKSNEPKPVILRLNIMQKLEKSMHGFPGKQGGLNSSLNSSIFLAAIPELRA